MAKNLSLIYSLIRLRRVDMNRIARTHDFWVLKAHKVKEEERKEESFPPSPLYKEKRKDEERQQQQQHARVSALLGLLKDKLNMMGEIVG